MKLEILMIALFHRLTEKQKHSIDDVDDNN